jgi:hypothetical protein
MRRSGSKEENRFPCCGGQVLRMRISVNRMRRLGSKDEDIGYSGRKYQVPGLRRSGSKDEGDHIPRMRRSGSQDEEDKVPRMKRSAFQDEEDQGSQNEEIRFPG